MSIGEILDRAIHILKANLRLFLGIAAFAEIVELAQLLAQDASKNSPSLFTDAAGVSIAIVEKALSLASLAAAAIATAAACKAAGCIQMNEPVTVREAYRTIRGRETRMLGVGFLEMFFSMWPVIPAAVLFVPMSSIVSGLPQPWLIAILVIAMAVPCALLFPRYVLGFSAAVIEGCTARQAIRRSVDLGQGHRAKAFWALLLPMAIGAGFAGGIALFLAWVQRASPAAVAYSFLWSDLADIGVVSVRLFTLPLGAIALTLVYYDMRVRKEGLDVALMMEQAGMPATEEEGTSAERDAWRQALGRKWGPGQDSVENRKSIRGASEIIQALEEQFGENSTATDEDDGARA